MNTMRGVQLTALKNLQHLRLDTVERPIPGPGEAQVAIHSAALNHRDVWIIQGLYAKIKLPVILGSDGAGEVSAVGDGVDPSWIGRPVLINPGLDWGSDPAVQQKNYRILGMPDNGTQAEYVTVPAENLQAKPDYLDWDAAAALPLAGLTGYRALFVQGQLKKGQTVLITGIGGGVAALMMQMALAAGAAVLVTSGDPNKIQRAVARGALGGVNYRTKDWGRELKELLADQPLDLVVDSAGGEGFSRLIDVVKPGGRIVFFGATAGNPPQINLRQIFWKQLTLQGTTMGTSKDFSEMIRFFSAQQITPEVDEVFSFGDYLKAYQKMMEGRQNGKLVLKW